MALITDSLVQKFWRLLYRSGLGKEDMKTGTLPTPVQIKAAVQAIEDRWDGDALNYKAAIDTALGFTSTNAQAKVIGRYWLQLKADRGNV